MKTEDLKRIILKMFRGKEFYGYDVNRRLSSAGVEVELSRLYRVLNEMLKEGLLDSRWEKSRSGPSKRMYRIGRKGEEELDRILLDAIATVHSFYGEYLLSLRPKINVFGEILGPVTDGLEGKGNVVYVTNKYYGIDEMIVSHLQRNVPEGRIYFVKPVSAAVDLNLKNLFILDGEYDDIPLKDGHADLLMIVDLPNRVALEAAVEEWRRVVGKDGRLAIMTPSILLQKYEDPLAIGDFVEKYEHEIIEEGEHIDGEQLNDLLKNSFETVDERQFVHISIILAFNTLSPA